MNNPLINEVNEYIKTFGFCLSKPQKVHFIHILKGMLFTKRKSINSYSESYTKHQSSLNRFMNSKAVNDNQIKQVLFENISSQIDKTKELDFILDDTIKHHKYSKHIYGLGRHHDHLEGGYSRGHSLVTAGLWQNNKFYPTDCELYIREEDVCETSSFVTKIELARAMLEQWVPKVDNILIDSWYSTKEFLSFIFENNKFFFTMLKKNRNVKIGRKRIRQLQEWEKYLDPRDFKIVYVDEQAHLVQEKICILPKVGKVKILFTKFYDIKTKKAGELHYLCTNNLELTAQEVLKKYKSRWPIEVFHKDIKQNLDFEKCIIRKKIGVKRHFLMTLITQNILVFCNQNLYSSGQIQKEIKYSYLESVLQNYGIPNHNLEVCKKELMLLC